MQYTTGPAGMEGRVWIFAALFAAVLMMLR